MLSLELVTLARAWRCIQHQNYLTYSIHQYRHIVSCCFCRFLQTGGIPNPVELIHWLLKNLIQPKTQSQPPYNSLGGPCTATQSLLWSWDMIQEPLTHVSAPLSAPFKALMAQKRIFKKRNYPLAVPGSVLWDGSLEARQQSLQSLVLPTKCPIYSECPVHNMNRLYVGHCTNSDFQDLIMLTAGNPVFCGTWEKSSTRLSTHTHDAPSTASEDDAPRLPTFFLHDCSAYRHILGGWMRWEHRNYSERWGWNI